MPYPSCVHDTGPGYIFHKNKVRLRGLISCSFCNLTSIYTVSFLRLRRARLQNLNIGWGFNWASGYYTTCGQLWYTQLLLFTSLFDRSVRRSLSSWHLNRVGKQPLRPIRAPKAKKDIDRLRRGHLEPTVELAHDPKIKKSQPYIEDKGGPCSTKWTASWDRTRLSICWGWRPHKYLLEARRKTEPLG